MELVTIVILVEVLILGTLILSACSASLPADPTPIELQEIQKGTGAKRIL